MTRPRKTRAATPNPTPESSSPSPASSSPSLASSSPSHALDGPPPTLPGSPTALLDDEPLSLADDLNDNVDPMIARILSGIAYTTMRLSQGLPIEQTTRFKVPVHSNNHVPTKIAATALSLLASPSSPAIIAFEEPGYIIFELGMPNPFFVAEGGAQVVSTPHWWVGKPAAVVKAGPHADEHEVQKAASALQGLETKRQKKVTKTKKEEELENKLAEGIRRQKAGLNMYDEDADEFEIIDEVEEDDFDQY